MVRDDNYADERASSDFEIRPDGSFTIVHVMSNGGSESVASDENMRFLVAPKNGGIHLLWLAADPRHSFPYE